MDELEWISEEDTEDEVVWSSEVVELCASDELEVVVRCSEVELAEELEESEETVLDELDAVSPTDALLVELEISEELLLLLPDELLVDT